jgi:hypothetical protein
MSALGVTNPPTEFCGSALQPSDLPQMQGGAVAARPTLHRSLPDLSGIALQLQYYQVQAKAVVLLWMWPAVVGYGKPE